MASSRFSRSPAVACGGGSDAPRPGHRLGRDGRVGRLLRRGAHRGRRLARPGRSRRCHGPRSGVFSGGPSRARPEQRPAAPATASSRCTTAARSRGGRAPRRCRRGRRPSRRRRACSVAAICRRTAPEGSQASTDPAPEGGDDAAGEPGVHDHASPRRARAPPSSASSPPSARGPWRPHAREGSAPLRAGRSPRAARRPADSPSTGASSKRSTRNVRSPASGAVRSRPTRYQAVCLNASP